MGPLVLHDSENIFSRGLNKTFEDGNSDPHFSQFSDMLWSKRAAGNR